MLISLGRLSFLNKVKIEELSKKLTDKPNNSAWNEKDIPNRLFNKQLNTNLQKANILVEKLSNQNVASNPEQIKEKAERTRIVMKPMDVNIKNSKDIRKQLNKDFPGVVIRNARSTPGGSILIEFDDKESAAKVENEWKEELFGNNSGLIKYGKNRSAGIIRHVYVDSNENEIKEEIKSNYPDVTPELFKKNNRFTGTIKINCNNEETLQVITAERMKIFNQRYMVEEYVPKRKVISCYRCQKFGHISKWCDPKNTPKCGKCSDRNHETRDCEVNEENYKCAHCDQNHQTGDPNCPIWKAKMDELSRRNNGF